MSTPKAQKTAAKKATTRKKVAKAPSGEAKKPLSQRQLAFVEEYCKDRNGAQAVIRAGYSEAGASVQAVRLLADARIKAKIDEFILGASQRAELTAERVLRELGRIALFDPRKLLRADGSPKPIEELDDDTAAGIAGLEVLEQYEGSGDDRQFVGYVKKYKIADKNSAIEKAMKHLGLFERDNKQKTDPLASLLQRVAGSGLPVIAKDAEE